MSLLNFQKPDKILLQKADDFEGLSELLLDGFPDTTDESSNRDSNF